MVRGGPVIIIGYVRAAEEDGCATKHKYNNHKRAYVNTKHYVKFNVYTSYAYIHVAEKKSRVIVAPE